MYLIKTPFWLRWLYPHLIWRKPAKGNSIYLTFDDGPIPVVTPFVLDTLKKFEARATFFCIGDNVRKHPDLFKSLEKNGHALGNHTFHHLKGWQTADSVYAEDFLKCRKLVPSSLFRPPYGRIKRSQIRKLQSLDPNLKIIMWDVLSGDFDVGLSPQRCLENVLNKTEAGSIIVFHDSLKAFERLEYVLPRALEHWRNRGFQFEILN